MNIGTIIKKRRFELNMSQQELANAMGYKTRSTIAKIESGENDVSQKKLIKFAEALDTTIEALLGVSTTTNFTSYSENISLQTNPPTFRNKNVCIILAGGKSIRNQKNIPSQFIDIHGKPVIVYCLEAYQNHPAIDDIYIVCLKGWENIVLAYAKKYNISKLKGLIPAASSGILSVKNGLDYINNIYSENDVVVFQESTRPMVNVEMISKLLQACSEKGQANICQSMKDYVQFTYIDNKAQYLNRNDVINLQSPEAYTIKTINKVFDIAKKQQHPLTESCCALLMYNLGYNINFIEGSANNIKIIRDEDLLLATTLLKKIL